MAFHPKSKTAMGLPARKNQTLSNQLDLGMKCFLRQTPLSQATIILRQSLARDDQQHNTVDYTKEAREDGNFSKKHCAVKGPSRHHGICQSAAKAFPVPIPRPSQIGKNTYQHFVHGPLSCEVKKREADFKSITRQGEERRLTVLSSLEKSREEMGYAVQSTQKNDACQHANEQDCTRENRHSRHAMTISLS